MYEKWSKLIKIRDACNLSIEEKRAKKEIGSSLEASLEIELNKELYKIYTYIKELLERSYTYIYDSEYIQKIKKNKKKIKKQVYIA